MSKKRGVEGQTMMQKILFTAMLCCLTLGFLGACKPVHSPKNSPLKIGMDLSYPPFETIDPEGNPTGVSVDLAKALGEYLHRPVEIENIAFTGLIPSLLTGKIDLIISSMSETPERHKTIEFSDPYVTSIGLCVLASQKSGIKSVADLDHPGRTVAVRQGTTGQLWAEQNLRNAKIVVLDKESSAAMEVVQGRVDGFLYDQLSVWKFHREHPAETIALLNPVKAEPWAAGLRLGDNVLKDQVNAFFKKFRSEGGFSRLGDKYLSEEKRDFSVSGVDFSFN
jgi:polar amino acid transport system substrate-binding protein